MAHAEQQQGATPISTTDPRIRIINDIPYFLLETLGVGGTSMVCRTEMLVGTGRWSAGLQNSSFCPNYGAREVVFSHSGGRESHYATQSVFSMKILFHHVHGLPLSLE